MSETRLFSLAEARGMLPYLKRTLAELIEISKSMAVYQQPVTEFAERAETNSGGPEGTAYVQRLLDLREHLNEIQESGVLIKSIEDGLVDFPHLRGGRVVYLCWRFGEDDIGFWHEVDTGFAGRRALDE